MRRTFCSAILVALGLSLAGCERGVAQGAEKASRPQPAVRTAQVERGPVARPVRSTGTVRLKSSYELGFKVGGVIAAIPVERGTRVKKGQLLARLDGTEYSARAAQARSVLDQAKRELARSEHLYASGAVARVELDNSRTTADVARSSLTAASFDARHSRIVAPDDGIVDAKLAEAGEVVTPGRPVLQLSGRSKGWIVRTALSDRDVLRVAVGDRATLALDADPTRSFPAEITEVATLATPATGTFEVELRVEDSNAPLRSGLTAKVTIDDVEQPAATVPLAALVDGNGLEASLFSVKDGQAKKHRVSLRFLEADRAALAALPPEITEVVTDGASELSDGSSIRVVK